MSAFLVNEDHIAELVKAFYKFDKFGGTWRNLSTGGEIDIDVNKFGEEKLAVAYFLA